MSDEKSNGSKQADILLHIEMGKAYLRRGRREDALRELKTALALAPDYPDLHHEIGVVYALTGNYEKAIEFFKKSIELNPKYLEPRLNLAITLSDAGYDKEAIEHFKAVKDIEKNSKFLFGAAGSRIANAHAYTGDLYFDVEAFDSAINEYKKGIEIAPDFLDIGLKLSKAYIAIGDFSSAEIQLLAILKKDPNFRDALRILGSINLKMGKKDKAKAIWTKMLIENPEDNEAQVLLNTLNDFENNAD
ncbi:tetratricopeptide repeat protein [candidate division WOR-3 bacterium]|nr:tetratricopeptide repeat protein [candidate division WOR-3 bacterium]